MTWFLLALASAVSLAFTDLFSKKALAGLPVPVVAWVRIAFPLPFLALVAAFEPWSAPRGPFWIVVASALPLEYLATLLYQKALQSSPLGLTAPYLAFTPAFLVFTGRWFLGESPSLQAYFGIALVVLGGYLIQLAPRMGPLDPLRALLREPGSRLMLAVAAIYSVTSALGKVGVLSSSATTFPLLYYLFLGVLLAPQALLSSKGLPRASLMGLLPISIFGSAMVLSHVLAIRIAPVSYMIAVKRTSLLWSILLGRLSLGEGNLRQRLFGGTIILAGVAVLALSP